MGIFNPVGEWAIIGGTGELTMARGTIKYKILQESAGIESIRELNIRAFYTPPSALVVSTKKRYRYLHHHISIEYFYTSYVCRYGVYITLCTNYLWY